MLEVFRVWNISYCLSSDFWYLQAAFSYIFSTYNLVVFFHFHAVMRVHALPDVPRQNRFPNLPWQPCCFLCGMLISPWTALLSSLLLYFCSLKSAMPALLYVWLTHVSMLLPFSLLSFSVFANLTDVSWYQP